MSKAQIVIKFVFSYTYHCKLSSKLLYFSVKKVERAFFSLYKAREYGAKFKPMHVHAYFNFNKSCLQTKDY